MIDRRRTSGVRTILVSKRAAISLLAALAATVPTAAAAETGSTASKPKSDAVPGPTVYDPLATLVEPGDTVRLSDERQLTRWARVNEPHPIRSAASTSASTITRLRFLTEDKLPEVYLVLGGRLDSNGAPWLQVRIPTRAKVRTGWVPADMLSQLFIVRTRLVVDRTARRATLFKAGRKIWQAPIGIGRAAAPTPTGNFWVRERLRGDGGVYGPWAFGTSAYSKISDWPKGGVVGIHGTNEPDRIPGRPSSGCIRVRNDKIKQLARLMPIGTPISIVD
jgi:lipoprotein-anchoring transpeptidase ErfK/SrfK